MSASTRALHLRARISSLSKTIQELGQERQAAQSELNAILDPMARVPLEIFTAIILQSLPAAPTWEDVLPLLQVCREWRITMQGISSLWTAVPYTDKGISSSKFPKALKTWLTARGEGGLISVSIRLENLQALWTVKFGTKHTLGALKSLTIEEVYKDDSTSDSESFPVRRCFETLFSAPDLVEFNCFPGFLRSTPKPLTHLTLRQLRLGRLEKGCPGIDAFLPYITLPFLETLCVYGPSAGALQQFFERSSPPLRCFQIQISLGASHEWLCNLLKLVPGLTDVDLMLGESRILCLESFATAGAEFLPVVRNLVVHQDFWHGNPASSVANFLAARHQALESFQLIVPHVRNEAVLRDIVAAVHGSANLAGKRIYIGTEDENFF